ncbi:hypothetical protein PJP07_31395, partial [Mycobacterium kansasii]
FSLADELSVSWLFFLASLFGLLNVLDLEVEVRPETLSSTEEPFFETVFGGPLTDFAGEAFVVFSFVLAAETFDCFF